MIHEALGSIEHRALGLLNHVETTKTVSNCYVYQRGRHSNHKAKLSGLNARLLGTILISHDNAMVKVACIMCVLWFTLQ